MFLCRIHHWLAPGQWIRGQSTRRSDCVSGACLESYYSSFDNLLCRIQSGQWMNAFKHRIQMICTCSRWISNSLWAVSQQDSLLGCSLRMSSPIHILANSLLLNPSFQNHSVSSQSDTSWGCCKQSWHYSTWETPEWAPSTDILSLAISEWRRVAREETYRSSWKLCRRSQQNS